jgi:hypothetical protein
VKAVLLKGNAAFRGFFIWGYGSAVARIAAPASQPTLHSINYWRLRRRSRRSATCCDDLSMRGKLSPARQRNA